MDDEFDGRPNTPAELTVDLVAAYVSRNHVQASELPVLIANVHAALSGLGSEVVVEPAGFEKPTPAQVRKSITPDALISFLDGKPYKALKRHLTKHGLTLEDYRARYGLPADYPSTSLTYSAKRSELARSLGLGQQRRKAAPKAAEAVQTISDTPKTRGRPRRAAEAPLEAPKARGRNKVTETA